MALCIIFVKKSVSAMSVFEAANMVRFCKSGV